MIVDRISIETIISYLLNKKEGTLFDKKEIFFLLRDTLKNTNNLEKHQIKYLGTGSHGVVIKPPIKFNLVEDIEINPKYDRSYVSKILINKDEKHIVIFNEYLIGNKLKKIDPNNDYFIYPIDLERSREFSNIIMKRGYPIKDYSKLFCEFDIYKIFFNLLNGIEKLIHNNILNMDIKSDNILLNHLNKSSYKCVFIDFTSDLIIETKEDFIEFCDNFQKHIHPYWPFEINCILNDSYKKRKNFKIEENDRFKNYEIEKNITSEYYFKNINKNLLNDLNHNIKMFFEKIMIYQLGKMFSQLINYQFLDYNTETYNKFKIFMKYLHDDNYVNRYTIKEIKEKFKFDCNDYTIKFKKK